MNIVIDDWWEMIITGIIILGMMYLLYLIIKQFFNHGGKVKTKDLIIGELKEDEPTRVNYINEHSKKLDDLNNKFIEMEKLRNEARMKNNESNKALHLMMRQLLISQDAILEAMIINKIGNGNLEKARKVLSSCFDIQDKYLISQL